MFPLLNGKSFLESTEVDLETLLDNEDYRENEYIDYKKNFSFLELSKGNDRNNKVCEFRNDVCAFANAEGGYLIYGISDKNGCADELIGIDIPEGNTDKFELDRRNNLASILPRIPYLKFHFVLLKNGKYVLILFVKHDFFTPYIHLENEKNYMIYKRSGNGKRVVGYQEIKNMFNQSLSLDKEIHHYRMERIDYYRCQEDNENHDFSQFFMMHIIPDTFADSSYNQSLFILEKLKNINFSSIFSSFGCGTYSIPCTDGLHFIPYSDYNKGSNCYLYNNGIAECFMPLNGYLSFGLNKFPNGTIAWKSIWDNIEKMYEQYITVMKDFLLDKKIYVCISILGCKGVTSETDDFNMHNKIIDRNTILCSPIVTANIENEAENTLLANKLYIEFLLSLGIKRDKSLDNTIREVYHV